MDSTTPNSPSSPEQTPAVSAQILNDFARHFQRLENFLIAGLLAIILTGFGVNIYLAKQMRAVRATLTEQRPMVKKFAEGFRQNDEPLIRNFLLSLQRYAMTNRDFQPVFEKYRPVLSGYMPPSMVRPPTATPPVNPVPAPKK